jgi:hypothetical protein
MELAWMLLANHAEVPPSGLLYLSGAGWDTINVGAELPDGAPDGGVVAFVQGVLVIRLLFHHTEAGTEFPFEVSIVDEDGAAIGHIDGAVTAEPPDEDAPPTWDRAAHVIAALTGLPLPRFGEYRIHLQVNREHKGDIPFRVVRRY